ncbi:MAG: hypothetical protein AB7R77_20265 [Ilumatobacteraceae bacterium]
MFVQRVRSERQADVVELRLDGEQLEVGNGVGDAALCVATLIHHLVDCCVALAEDGDLSVMTAMGVRGQPAMRDAQRLLELAADAFGIEPGDRFGEPIDVVLRGQERPFEIGEARLDPRRRSLGPNDLCGQVESLAPFGR